MAIQVANQYIFEGTVSGTATVNFGATICRMTLTNDSATKDLSWRVNSTQTYATLKPTESVSLDIRTDKVHLSGNGPYRAWGFN